MACIEGGGAQSIEGGTWLLLPPLSNPRAHLNMDWSLSRVGDFLRFALMQRKRRDSCAELEHTDLQSSARLALWGDASPILHPPAPNPLNPKDFSSSAACRCRLGEQQGGSSRGRAHA